LENIGVFKQRIFINDSASTNPESAIAAIRSVSNIGMIILGGLDRGYDFTELVKIIAENKISNFILFPDTQEKISQLLKKICHYQIQIYYCQDMKSAVYNCYKYAPIGSSVLLSTGTPSFNMFANFPDRGEQFKKWVKYYAQS
jgi:UDP-N-acetylmuramoylalanine-D-glutamate ligase